MSTEPEVAELAAVLEADSLDGRALHCCEECTADVAKAVLAAGYRKSAEDDADEIDGLHALVMRQGSILTRVANALNSQPPERVSWSHHDLGEKAEALVAKQPRTITTAEELDALPAGTILRCLQERQNPEWPSVFLHTGSQRAPWLHLDPSDREDGESTLVSGTVLHWYGDGSATVLWEPEA